jgi:hypothetical protein
MLKLVEGNPSYIDFSHAVEISALSWAELKNRLRPDPCSAIKANLSYYSVINRGRLGDVLAAAGRLFPVYRLDVQKRIFHVHHGVADMVANTLDLRSDLFPMLKPLFEEAVKIGKVLSVIDRLVLIDAELVLYDEGDVFSNTNSITMDPTILREDYEDYKYWRHLKCPEDSRCGEHGFSFEEHCAEVTGNIHSTVSDIIRKELEIAGVKPAWDAEV